MICLKITPPHYLIILGVLAMLFSACKKKQIALREHVEIERVSLQSEVDKMPEPTISIPIPPDNPEDWKPLEIKRTCPYVELNPEQPKTEFNTELVYKIFRYKQQWNCLSLNEILRIKGKNGQGVLVAIKPNEYFDLRTDGLSTDGLCLAKKKDLPLNNVVGNVPATVPVTFVFHTPKDSLQIGEFTIHIEGTTTDYTQLAFADEFNAVSLDSKFWSVGSPNQRTGLWDRFYKNDHAHVSVQNGNLRLTATYNWHGNHHPETGGVHTRGKLQFKEAEVLVRARPTKTAEGSWAMIWASAFNAATSSNARLYMLEYFNRSDRMNASIRYIGVNEHQANGLWVDPNQFYLYTLRKDANNIQVLFNGNTSAQRTRAQGGGNVFDSEFYLIMNQSSAPRADGLNAETTYSKEWNPIAILQSGKMPFNLDIDYVRVYTKTCNPMKPTTKAPDLPTAPPRKPSNENPETWLPITVQRTCPNVDINPLGESKNVYKTKTEFNTDAVYRLFRYKQTWDNTDLANLVKVTGKDNKAVHVSLMDNNYFGIREDKGITVLYKKMSLPRSTIDITLVFSTPQDHVEIMKFPIRIEVTNTDFTKLTFADEFNFTNTIDPVYWSRTNPDYPYAAIWARFIKPNDDKYTYVQGGKLHLRANYNWNTPHGPETGAVHTLNKLNIDEAELIVNARTAKRGTGSWSAVWVMAANGKYGNWPSSGEIDMLEHIDNSDRVWGIIKYGRNASGNPSVNAAKNVWFNRDQAYNYVLQKEKDRVAVYLNQQLISERRRNQGGGTWPFENNFYLIMNQSSAPRTDGGGGIRTYRASDGWWPQPLNWQQMPFELEIDYVRVWEKTCNQKKPKK